MKIVKVKMMRAKTMTEFNLPPRPPLPPKPSGMRPPTAQPQVADFVKTVEAPAAPKAAATKPVRKGRSNRTIMPVALSSLLAFLAITAFLGSQVAGGQDPKLGIKQVAKVEPQQVLIKKKIVTRKVVKIVSAPTQSSSSSGQSYNAQAQTYSAPSQTYSAPAQTYSAPVQSTPAPVQTATS